MKPDLLKEYIEEHRGEFDRVELPEGHLDRLLSKMPEAAPSQARRRGMGRRVYYYLVSGAACLACLVAGVSYLSSGRIDDAASTVAGTVAVTDIPDRDYRREMAQARMYYRMQIEMLEATISSECSQLDVAVAKTVMADTRRLLCQTERFETELLPALQASESGTYLMVTHYTATINSLNNILEIITTRS